MIPAIFLYLVATIDGFALGSTIFREIGARPIYLILSPYFLMLALKSKKVISFILLFFVILIAFFLAHDVPDIFRYVSHSAAFLMMILSLSDGVRLTKAGIYSGYKLGAYLYILLFLLGNSSLILKRFLCDNFSQACQSHLTSYGISSEPSFLGIGLFISVILIATHSIFSRLLGMLAALIICIYLSSKTGLLSILIALTVYVLLRKEKKCTFILGSLFVLTMIVFGSQFDNFVVDTSFLIRASSSACALEVFSDNIFTGVGFGQFTYHINNCTIYQSWGVLEPTLSETGNRASTYVLWTRLLAEGGIIAFLIVIYLVLRLYRRLNKEASFLKIYAFSAIIALTFSQDSFLVPYIPLLVGLILTPKHSRENIHN